MNLLSEKVIGCEVSLVAATTAVYPIGEQMLTVWLTPEPATAILFA